MTNLIHLKIFNFEMVRIHGFIIDQLYFKPLFSRLRCTYRHLWLILHSFWRDRKGGPSSIRYVPYLGACVILHTSFLCTEQLTSCETADLKIVTIHRKRTVLERDSAAILGLRYKEYFVRVEQKKREELTLSAQK